MENPPTNAVHRSGKIASMEIFYYDLNGRRHLLDVPISINNSFCKAGLVKRHLFLDHTDDYDLICQSIDGTTKVYLENEPLNLTGNEILILAPRGSFENTPARAANMSTIVLRQYGPSAEEGDYVNE